MSQKTYLIMAAVPWFRIKLLDPFISSPVVLAWFRYIHNQMAELSMSTAIGLVDPGTIHQRQIGLDPGPDKLSTRHSNT